MEKTMDILVKEPLVLQTTDYVYMDTTAIGGHIYTEALLVSWQPGIEKAYRIASALPLLI